jgi:hypothetical protein
MKKTTAQKILIDNGFVYPQDLKKTINSFVISSNNNSLSLHFECEGVFLREVSFEDYELNEDNINKLYKRMLENVLAIVVYGEKHPKPKKMPL